MRRTPGLFRLSSSKTFQYRCRVPQDLVTRIGRRELKRSLGTTDPAVARSRALAVGHAAHRLFLAIRQDPLLGPNDITELMRGFYARRLDDDIQARAHASASGLGLPIDRAGLMDACRRQLAGCDVGAIEGPVDAFLAERGVVLERGGREDLLVRVHLMRAELEAIRRMLERDQGVFYGEPDDPLLKGLDPLFGTMAGASAQPQLPQLSPAPGPVDEFEYADNANLTITAYADLVVAEKGFAEDAEPVFDPESGKTIRRKTHALKYDAARTSTIR